jgi:broad specificity phosphatase PhoE
MIPSRTFYFLRHGQTDWNRDGRYQGTSDTPLNETGVTQAKAAASAIATVRINRIVASPLIRALKTAEIVAEKTGVPIYVDRDLRERHFGSFEGLVIKEVKQKHALPLDQSSRSIMPSDADHWDEIFERAPPAIGRWLTTHESETLLFVAHGGVFDAIHAHLIGPRVGPESKHASPYKIAPIPSGWLFTLLAA